MSFSLEILDDILINKVVELNKRLDRAELPKQCSNNNDIEFNSRISLLEDRINFVENQCKILSNLFNVCKNQTFDNKLIQTMLLDLTASIHNNGAGLNVLKRRLDASEKYDYLTDSVAQQSSVSTTSQTYNYKDKNTWTKVKKKKKNHRK